MKNRKPQTATETYTERLTEAKNLLGALNGWIAEAEKTADSANWAQVGDLGRVNEKLWEILEHLGREAE